MTGMKAGQQPNRCSLAMFTIPVSANFPTAYRYYKVMSWKKSASSSFIFITTLLLAFFHSFYLHCLGIHFQDDI